MDGDKNIGVNLGGWFIPEKWMSPSLFDHSNAEDLYGLLKAGGTNDYFQHLDSWIKEADFAWLAEHEVKIIRLPIGYWSLVSDTPYPDVSSKLDWVFTMAEKYNLKILLDLHGLKGSQNGKVHSGRAGRIDWQSYQEESIQTLIRLAKRYKSSSSLWGIEIMNEPAVGFRYFSLIRFYRRVYQELQGVLPSGVYTVFNDGFLPLLLSGAVKSVKGHPVMMDTHIYAMPNILALNKTFYFWLQKWVYRATLWLCQLSQPTIVGEWSAVLPQKLFDQTPKSEHGKLMAENIAHQRYVYERAYAHMYWNYKTTGDGMWNFRSLVENGDLVIK